MDGMESGGEREQSMSGTAVVLEKRGEQRGLLTRWLGDGGDKSELPEGGLRVRWNG